MMRVPIEEGIPAGRAAPFVARPRARNCGSSGAPPPARGGGRTGIHTRKSVITGTLFMATVSDTTGTP